MNYIEHLKALPEDERESEVESKLSETEHGILNAEAVSSEINMSNALGWGVDTTEILSIDISRPDQVRVKIGFTLSGEQDDDKSFCGTSIEGEAVAIIDEAGHVRYTNVTAERDLGDEDEPEG